jgi:hypothetical protein
MSTMIQPIFKWYIHQLQIFIIHIGSSKQIMDIYQKNINFFDLIKQF